MLTSAWEHVILFLAIVVGGVYLERFILDLHFRMTKKKVRKDHFVFGRYLYLLSLPLFAALLMTYTVGISVVIVFILFSLAGPILEYGIGKSYHQFVGKRLWTYYRYNIGTYTSYLSIPFWA